MCKVYFDDNGKIHREDGPAVESENKGLYFIHGKHYPLDNFIRYLYKNNKPIPKNKDIQKHIDDEYNFYSKVKNA